MTPLIILLILLYIPLAYAGNFILMVFKEEAGIAHWHQNDAGVFFLLSFITMPIALVCQIIYQGSRFCGYIVTNVATKENFSFLFKSSKSEVEQLKAELAALKAGKK